MALKLLSLSLISSYVYLLNESLQSSLSLASTHQRNPTKRFDQLHQEMHGSAKNHGVVSKVSSVSCLELSMHICHFFSSINDKPSFLLLQKDEDKDKMMASLKSSASTRQVFHEQFDGLITRAFNGEAEAIASLAALVDNSQTRGVAGKSSDVFRCSTLDMNNKLKMEKNGGSKQFNL